MNLGNTKFRYRLGLDVGVASLGIAILALEGDKNKETGEPNYKIHGGSVLTYPLPEGAAERREKRGMRRNIERRNRRLDRISDLLTSFGISSPRKQTPKTILDLSPIKLRAKASREQVELAHLARAFLHMARHRGSNAFRESEIKEDKESRQTADGIKSLRQEMKDKNFQTYGQYLRWREKKNLPIRINQTKMADSKDGYIFYPSRQMLREEFEIIWTCQIEFYPEYLTAELKEKVSDELFFQRAVTSPPPGKCPYFNDENRLPRASRLFQTRRIYEEVNHLRFSGKSGEPIKFDLVERNKIVKRLMAGEDLTFAKIKETIDLKRTDKVSLEASKARKGIEGYCFDRVLGDENLLGEVWHNAEGTRQDEILTALATIHDDGKAIAALTILLDGEREVAKRLLEASLPSGWGHMGLTATEKILVELKKDVVPARVAEDRAGLFHAMTETGEVRDTLPYYGEILIGHTVDPMWVSDYRRLTDHPPHTNQDELKYGRIPNPVVHLALNQIRRAVNAVIKKHGLPESIHIELARELNKSAEAREKLAKLNEKNKVVNDQVAEELEKHSITANRLNIQKYKLWKEQQSVCVYTGKTLCFSDLYNGNVDVDHILPRSKTFSDSMANKVICVKGANADKKNRPPYEAFAHNPNYDWDCIMRRVERLQQNKQWRFSAEAMKDFEDGPESFRKRYGVDNAYIARVTRQYLGCLFGEQHKVVAVSSYIVSLLRGKWGMNKILSNQAAGKKNREDHRHHFVDALATACASRGMVQRIQLEAARCERQQLDVLIETLAPPFGTPKEFFNAAREATLKRVTLARKADHAKTGQLHEDRLLGIVEGPDKGGQYVCRKRTSLAEFKTFEALNKVKIQSTLPNHPEIEQAKQALQIIKDSIQKNIPEATQELESKRSADIMAGKKDKKILDTAIFNRAVQLHKNIRGRTNFTLFEKNKLVNIRRGGDSNRLAGGYISGRNHRMDFYLDAKKKLRWQVISMMDANDKYFITESRKTGNILLYSAHKEDVLEMDDPCGESRRIRVVVAKFRGQSMGVVPEADARDSKERVLWEKGLSFFQNANAQRIITDALGDVTWRFPALPNSKNRGLC
jgi:CRISPR-associated endonuclease Csn1